MSKYLICTLAEYEKGLADGVPLDEQVSLHDPIYSPDGKWVLIKGIGELTEEEVQMYIQDNWAVVEVFPEAVKAESPTEVTLPVEEPVDYTDNQPSQDDPV